MALAICVNRKALNTRGKMDCAVAKLICNAGTDAGKCVYANKH